MLFVPSGAGINFHNAHISSAVEIGLIGPGPKILCIDGGAISITLYALIRRECISTGRSTAGRDLSRLAFGRRRRRCRPVPPQRGQPMTERNASPADVRTPRLVARGSGAGQDIGPLSPVLDGFAKSQL